MLGSKCLAMAWPGRGRPWRGGHGPAMAWPGKGYSLDSKALLGGEMYQLNLTTRLAPHWRNAKLPKPKYFSQLRPRDGSCMRPPPRNLDIAQHGHKDWHPQWPGLWLRLMLQFHEVAAHNGVCSYSDLSVKEQSVVNAVSWWSGRWQ